MQGNLHHPQEMGKRSPTIKSWCFCQMHRWMINVKEWEGRIPRWLVVSAAAERGVGEKGFWWKVEIVMRMVLLTVWCRSPRRVGSTPSPSSSSFSTSSSIASSPASSWSASPLLEAGMGDNLEEGGSWCETYLFQCYLKITSSHGPCHLWYHYYVMFNFLLWQSTCVGVDKIKCRGVVPNLVGSLRCCGEGRDGWLAWEGGGGQDEDEEGEGRGGRAGFRCLLPVGSDCLVVVERR